MTVEMGEYVVGAGLREVAGCDFVDYDVRPPAGGSEGQSEFDVVGFHFRALQIPELLRVSRCSREPV